MKAYNIITFPPTEAAANAPAFGDFRAPVYQTSPSRRRTKSVALGITILLHLLVLWYVLFRAPLEKQSAPAASEGRFEMTLAPLSAKAVKQPKSVQAQPQPAQAPRKRQQRRPTAPTITLPNPNPVIPLPPPEPAKADPSPAPADDMMADIEARRKRRAEAEARDNPAPETEAQRANRIAAANIAAQRKSMGIDNEESGGVFQMKTLHYHDAEFVFNGWNKDFRRRWGRMVSVEQGSEPNIEIAVVKKMIEVIREEKTGDFSWESHRLGRVVTLSARLQDQKDLEQFLLLEIFHDDGARVR